MFYGEYDKRFTDLSKVTLPTKVHFSFKYDNIYSFIIPKPISQYLYFGPSQIYNYDSKSKITIANLYSISKVKYKVLGELAQSGQQTFTPTDERKYCAYYIRLDNFPKNIKVKFKVEITDGNFEHEYMFYKYSNEELNNDTTITLPNNVKSDSSGIFSIPTASYKFLYFAPPPPTNFVYQSRVTVYNKLYYVLLGELSKYSEKTFTLFD